MYVPSVEEIIIYVYHRRTLSPGVPDGKIPSFGGGWLSLSSLLNSFPQQVGRGVLVCWFSFGGRMVLNTKEMFEGRAFVYLRHYSTHTISDDDQYENDLIDMLTMR